MKKVIILSLLFVTFLKSQAQEADTLKKGLQEVTLSIYGGNFFSSPKFDTPIFTMAPSVNFYTLYSHHHLQYDIINNGIGIINGIYVWEIDFYHMVIRYPGNWYMSIGVEKYFQLGDKMGGLFFVERGGNFHEPAEFNIGWIFEFPLIKN